MATITVRALDPNTWEPQQGNGQANFISDRDAVAQIIATSLKLFQGEWWLDLSDGLPMFQSIEGSSGTSRNVQLITNIIVARIQGCPYVISVTNVSASFSSRRYAFKCSVVTQFGTLIIGNNPGNQATLPASIK